MTTRAHIVAPLNKTSLGEAVAAELGLSYEQGVRTVETVLDIVTRAVVGGHPVTVTNFGTWTPVQCPARTMRDPRNGARMTVPARQELRFRVSPRLRELVQAEDPDAATIRKNPKGPAS